MSSSKKNFQLRGRGSFVPTPLLASAIEAVTKPFYRSLGFRESRLVLEWEKIVGSHLATMSMPIKVSSSVFGKDATLTLLVESAAAPELMHCTHQIIEKINNYFGSRYIAKVVLKHHSLTFLKEKPSQGSQKDSQQEKPSRCEKEAKVEPLIEEVRDEALQRALRSLGRGIFLKKT